MRPLAWLLSCTSLLACRPDTTPRGGPAQLDSVPSGSAASMAAPTAAAAVLRLRDRASGPIYDVTWSRNGKWLVTACGVGCADAKAEGQRVLVFELPSLKLRAELVPNAEDMGDGRIHGVDFNADASRLAVSTHNGVTLFETTGFTRVADVEHAAIYGGFKFSPDGKYLGLSGVYGVVHVVDAATGQTVLEDQLHNGAGSMSAGLAWTKDSKTMIVDGNANFGTWTPGAKKIARIVGDTGAGGMGFFDLSPDEKWLLLGESDGCLASLYAMATRKLAQKLTASPKTFNPTNRDTCRASFSSNGAWVAAIDTDAGVRLWQTGSAAKPVVVRRPAPVEAAQSGALVFSPDSKLLLYAIGDVAGIWDIAKQRPANINAPPGAIRYAWWLTPNVIEFMEENATIYFDLERQQRIERPADVPEGSLDPSGKLRSVVNGDLRLRRADGAELWLRTVLEGDKRKVVMVDSRGRVSGDDGLAASDVYDVNGGAKLPPRVEGKVAERFFAGD